MSMPQFITKFRRDRWRDQVIAVGQRIRELEVARAGIDSSYAVAAEIDADIDRLTRRRERLLDNLRRTA